jgi:hypothetical protein
MTCTWTLRWIGSDRQPDAVVPASLLHALGHGVGFSI